MSTLMIPGRKNPWLTSALQTKAHLSPIIITLVLFWATPISAQWTTNGNNISNTNSGNVEVLTKVLLIPVGTDQNPVFQFNQSGNPGFFIKNIGGTNQIVAVTSGPDSSFMFQNRSPAGYAGPTFLNSSGGVAVFTGYSNSTGEYRVNNVASGGAIKFMLGTPVLTIENGTTTIVGNLTNSGNITAAGTITGGNIVAKYQDVAEWVETSESLLPGTVVVVNHHKTNQVIASSQSYDTRVAGVISAQPGIALGEAGQNKVLVATTGRVRIKVDASRGPIAVGDLLVTSDVPGVAMKSRALNVGGIKLHRPGTLIGKALEPLAKGRGEILVLLSLQ